MLRAGGYRTASQYLYTLKKAHVKQGHQWTEGLTALLGDLKRGCARGLGGPRQADALGLDKYDPATPFIHAGVKHPAEAVITGAWWLLREIEVANIRAADVLIEAGPGCGIATINVSASKTDYKARGCRRTLGCVCPSAICPVRAVAKLAQGCAGREPIVQSTTGKFVAKSAMVDLTQAFAAHVGTTPGAVITGHSLRTTGAQRMAEAGIE